MVKCARIALLVGLLSLLLGCSATDQTEEMEVDIRGTVAEVHHIEGAGSDQAAIIGNVLIEGEVEGDTKYDRASITITNETAVYELRDGERVRITFAGVAPGQRAEARFAGPVMETYPYQGTAAELVILTGG